MSEPRKVHWIERRFRRTRRWSLAQSLAPEGAPMVLTRCGREGLEEKIRTTSVRSMVTCRACLNRSKDTIR